MSKKIDKISNWDTLPVILDVHLVALIFDVSEVTIKRWVNKNILIGKKIGNKLLFDKEYIRSIIPDKVQPVN